MTEAVVESHILSILTHITILQILQTRQQTGSSASLRGSPTDSRRLQVARLSSTRTVFAGIHLDLIYTGWY